MRGRRPAPRRPRRAPPWPPGWRATIAARQGDRTRTMTHLQTALERARKRGDEGIMMKVRAMMAQMGGGVQ